MTIHFLYKESGLRIAKKIKLNNKKIVERNPNYFSKGI